MSTTSIGRHAEQKAADYLTQKYGYDLLVSNWRTRTCEIDLIMQSRTAIHFIEVKYRKNYLAGGGLESISKAKLKRMYDGAHEWLEQNSEQLKLNNLDINIAAIELTGRDCQITKWINSIDFDS